MATKKTPVHTHTHTHTKKLNRKKGFPVHYSLLLSFLPFQTLENTDRQTDGSFSSCVCRLSLLSSPRRSPPSDLAMSGALDMALDDLIKNSKKEPRGGSNSNSNNRRGARNGGGGRNGGSRSVSGPIRRSNVPRSRPSPYFMVQARKTSVLLSFSLCLS